MPTNRARRTRAMRPQPISAKLRAFFETGANDNQTPEDGDIFITACSDQKMLAAWLPYREEILQQWKKEKRPGLPWVEGHLKANGLL